MATGREAVRACFGSADRGQAPGEAPQAVPAKDRVMQSRACLQFGHAASIRNRLRRANGAIQASGLQPLPGAPAANLSRLAARQSTSSHNLYAPNTILNAALTPSPGRRSLRRFRPASAGASGEGFLAVGKSGRKGCLLRPLTTWVAAARSQRSPRTAAAQGPRHDHHRWRVPSCSQEDSGALRGWRGGGRPR